MPGPRGPRGPKPKIENPGKLMKRLIKEIWCALRTGYHRNCCQRYVQHAGNDVHVEADR